MLPYDSQSLLGHFQVVFAPFDSTILKPNLHLHHSKGLKYINGISNRCEGKFSAEFFIATNSDNIR